MQKKKKLCVIFITCCLLISIFSVSANASVFYSQHNNALGTQWSITHLDSLYFPNMATCSSYCGSYNKCRNTPLYASTSFSGEYYQLDKPHLRKWGCYVTSIAMVLRNMNVTTVMPQYDVRTGGYGYLYADPYTVTMANAYWPTITWNSESGRYEALSYTSFHSPVYISSYNYIASSFGKNIYEVSFSGMDAATIAFNLDYYINQNPEGVLVSFEDHMMVFTESYYNGSIIMKSDSAQELKLASPVRLTPENEHLYRDSIPTIDSIQSRSVTRNSHYDGMFRCCDPAADTEADGNNVWFTQCEKYDSKGGIENIIRIRYFD